LLADFAQFPGLYQRLVVDRNKAWADVLDELTASETVSAVVVGALHLVGEDSLIELLRERGFTVSELR
jgi:uncharacterized protein YbaP (TraB family)